MTHAEDDLETRARRRVGMKMGWYTHALVYVLVNLGLFALDRAGGGPNWSTWPLLGWGIGLAVHGVVTLVGLKGEGFRERMLEQERRRLRERG